MKYLKTKKYRKYFRAMALVTKERLRKRKAISDAVDRILKERRAIIRLEHRMREAERFCNIYFTTS